jgi:hypothetical protein
LREDWLDSAATLADNPVADAKVAEAKLRSIALAAEALKKKYQSSEC